MKCLSEWLFLNGKWLLKQVTTKHNSRCSCCCWFFFFDFVLAFSGGRDDDDVEWTFGGGDSDGTGVFEHSPKGAGEGNPGCVYR